MFELYFHIFVLYAVLCLSSSGTVQCIATIRTIFPLGVQVRTVYDTCMDNHTYTFSSKDDTDQHVSDPKSLFVSAMLPSFLDHLRVEEHRTPSTLIRYESHIQKFITMVGDCPITQISSEHLSLYKRRLLDASLAPSTMAAMLSGLRSFLRYLKEPSMGCLRSGEDTTAKDSQTRGGVSHQRNAAFLQRHSHPYSQAYVIEH
jgi:hypothetical protein